jgi:Cu/Ag efflux protein CusF
MKPVLAALAVVAFAAPAAAQHHNHAAPAASAPAVVQGVGVVKSVDAKAGTITIAHEPIKALNWSAMTMAFKAADPALLRAVAPGDRVSFQLKGQQVVAVKKL